MAQRTPVSRLSESSEIVSDQDFDLKLSSKIGRGRAEKEAREVRSTSMSDRYIVEEKGVILPPERS